MKKLSFYLIAFIVSSAILFSSCGGGTTENIETTDSTAVEQVQAGEFDILVKYLEENGDFVNSKSVPAMIKSKEVHENIGNDKYLIVDLRKGNAFNKGHIEGADNIAAKDLLQYFENDIMATDYDKIVFVCYSGQSASFATGVMRLLGYNNVYAMKFGMSSWNKQFAEGVWMKHISNDFAEKIETTSNAQAAAGAYPTISTGKTEGKDILRLRAKEVLSLSYKSLLVKAPELFENGSAYYINNYWPEGKYAEGHIPGAIRYQPKKSLGTATQLSTLPVDKKVVTYCFTGQHSAFVTAYLKIMGYDAYSLAYGANSFMNGLMQERGDGWHAFSEKAVHDFEFVVEDVEDEVEEEDGGGGCS